MPLRESSDSFRHAPGQRGLVMAAFTLASCDVAFKVIRDHIQRPKEIGREHVMAKYQLVFQHDRAGRLVDAQEFEHLRLRAPALRARAARGLPLPRAAAATRRRRGDGRRGREVFRDAHGELLTPHFWWDMQERLRAGELPEIFPHDASRRLAHRRRA